MNRVLIVMAALLAIVAAGCKSNGNSEAAKQRMSEAMDSWMGHSRDDLIAGWGPPSQEMQGSNGTIIVYEYTGQIVVPGRSQTHVNVYGYDGGGSAYGTTTYQPAQAIPWSAYREFFLDADGKVYRWAWKGL